MIYPVESTIQRLNNRGQENETYFRYTKQTKENSWRKF